MSPVVVIIICLLVLGGIYLFDRFSVGQERHPGPPRRSVRYLILLLTVAVVGILGACLEEGGPETILSASSVYVIDGDTIAHGDVRYRLMGFDTPETRRAKCASERNLGLKAKDRLTQFITQAGSITLKSQPRPNKYGRILARGFVQDTNVADVLISEGLARPYAGGKRLPWCDPYSNNPLERGFE